MHSRLLMTTLACAAVAGATVAASAPALAVGGNCSASVARNSGLYRVAATCSTLRSDSKAMGELVVWGPLPNKSTDWITTSYTTRYSGYSATSGYAALHMSSR